MEEKMTNRKRAALETRRHIVEAARSVFARKGFAEATIRDIVEAAGTAAGTFYTYFKRKEDVIDELNRTDFYQLADTVNAMKDKGILERLDHYSRKFMLGIELSGLEVCRQWIRCNVAPAKMCHVDEDITKYQYDIRAMRSILEQGIADGLLKDGTPVNDLAELINAELYGLMTVWCMSDTAVTGSGEVAKYRSLFLEKALAPYLTGKEG